MERCLCHIALIRRLAAFKGLLLKKRHLPSFFFSKKRKKPAKGTHAPLSQVMKYASSCKISFFLRPIMSQKSRNTQASVKSPFFTSHYVTKVMKYASFHKISFFKIILHRTLIKKRINLVKYLNE